MGIQQLSISRIKGKMKHKLSSSIREKRKGMGDDNWVERERGMKWKASKQMSSVSNTIYNSRRFKEMLPR